MTRTDTDVFAGHRDRMRAKLRSFGTEHFETYELIEMLLYNVITRKNTHPTAKLLLKEFKTLNSLFSAEREALSGVLGIGKSCAEFLSDVGAFLNCEEKSLGNKRKIFTDFSDIGSFFEDYFRGRSENEIAILLLDPNLAYLGIQKVYSLDLSSGAVHPKPFIDAAINAGASVCAIAHNHPHSSPFPTDGDWETFKLLKAAFDEAGLVLLEGYVVTNEGYKRHSGGNVQKRADLPTVGACYKKSGISAYLLPVFRHGFKDYESLVSLIDSHFNSKEELFETDIKRLEIITKNERAAELIVILAALAARKATEGFRLGIFHTEEEIKNLLLGFYKNVTAEAAVILPQDSEGRIKAVVKICEGTSNSLNVTPRKILEALAAHSSSDFILAHNHPGGVAEPSDEDIASTKLLANSLLKCGAHLNAHYVIAKGECQKIEISEK